MPNWTPEQRQAIDARNRTILVSAAAGSGKTAVLVERIASLLQESADTHLKNMMIVTFTTAAAGEMRQRLARTLKERYPEAPEIYGQALDELEGTQISTIHAFCQQLLREEFQAAGISPMFGIADDKRTALLFEEAARDALNALLEPPVDESVAFLTEAYSLKQVLAWNNELYKALMAMPHPFEWLKAAVDSIPDPDYAHQPWYQAAFGELELRTGQARNAIARLLAMKEDPMCPDLRKQDADDAAALAEAFLRRIEDPETRDAALKEGVKFPNLRIMRKADPAVKKWSDGIFKPAHEALKDSVGLQILSVFKGMSPDDPLNRKEDEAVHKACRGLQLLAEETHRRYFALKLRANVLDFSDLEQLTMQILDDPALRERLQGRYSHIFVDECQDVSAIDDAIVQRLHGDTNALFMVGDVKQSIYRFRQADPTLFMEKLNSYSRDPFAEERRIDLQKNFRSRAAVLDATNRLFRAVMRAEVNEIDYAPEDELIPGRVTENDPPVEIILADSMKDIKSPEEPGEWKDRLDALKARPELSKPIYTDALCVAERIRELVDHGCDGLPPFRYRDIVILMPRVANGAGETVARVLLENGIPSYFDGGSGYFDLPEVRQLRDMLSCIDNAHQDQPLITTLKLSPFLMEDRQLAEIRLCSPGKNVPFYEAFAACAEQPTELGILCHDAMDFLSRWHELAGLMPLADFIWSLLRETEIYALSGAMPGGAERQANLTMLCDRAETYEQTMNGGLHGFLTYMEELKTVGGDDDAARMVGENEDLVRILTMHKSKGLEFPVVFLMNLGNSGKNKTKELKLHPKLGLHVPYANPALNLQRDGHRAMGFQLKKNADERAERCRLLYVAMTRAREKLIIVCNGRGDVPLWKAEPSPNRVAAANSMNNWLMCAAHDELGDIIDPALAMDYSDRENTFQQLSTVFQQAGTPYVMRVWAPLNSKAVEKSEALGNVSDAVLRIRGGALDPALAEQWAQLAMVPEEAPMKTSVTALVHGTLTQLPQEDEEFETDEGRPEKAMPVIDRRKELQRRPAFMEKRGLTGTERGTLTHKLLSLTDLAALRDAKDLYGELNRQLREMTDRGKLTQDELLAAEPRLLLRFYQSDIGRRLLKAAEGETHREWQFNMRWKENSLVQGVIDCAFKEDGQWVIVDYKTDRDTTPEVLLTHYARQLRLYAGAVVTITGEPVKEMWLFPLRGGSSVRVEGEPEVPEEDIKA